MTLQIFLLLAGFVLLIKGADWLVEGASALAKKYRIPDLAIGLTIVAFGTSAPELVVNVYSSMQNHHDIVFANVIGSNMFNLFAILGIAGLISPLVVQSSTVWKEIPFSLFALVVLVVLGNDFFLGGDNIISIVDASVLLIFFCLFLYYIYRQMRSDRTDASVTDKHLTIFKITLFIVLGFAGLVFGGRLVVINAVELAAAYGVSEKIIGLTIVAAGTSLPELATSVVAAYRKNNDIAVGNIVGSNIFNIFLILGVSGMIRPLNFNPTFNTDIYLVIAGTLLLFLAMFLGGKKRLDRWEAAILLMVYVGYTVYLIQMEV
ncbi:MAG: calcium/sodium antiporter [Lentimicrobium sp.]|jgi:cation:H+ antiporter|nr:calcium/sodium antiporter [Lentimicrobium sp.]